MLNKLKLRLRALFFRSKLENELREEVRFHLEKEIDQNLSRGMNLEEARSAALRSFGGVELIRRQRQDGRGIRFLEELWQDLGYGLRILLKKPGFFAVAVITLALGISANTAIFSLINAVLLRPYPHIDTDRWVYLYEQRSAEGMGHTAVSVPNFRDWKQQSKSFADMVLWISLYMNISSGAGEPERLEATVVTPWILMPWG